MQMLEIWPFLTVVSRRTEYRFHWLKTLLVREADGPENPPLVLVALYGTVPPHLMQLKGAKPLNEDGRPSPDAPSLLQAMHQDLSALFKEGFVFTQ